MDDENAPNVLDHRRDLVTLQNCAQSFNELGLHMIDLPGIAPSFVSRIFTAAKAADIPEGSH